MGGAAGPSAAVNYGLRRTNKQQPEPAGTVSTEVHDAWRLAFVVVADVERATLAVSKGARVDPDEAIIQPGPLRLLEATLRISLTRAAESPPVKSGSAVTTAFWLLPAEQRAALWLARVNELDTQGLGLVLGLTSVNAGHVAARAAEWLDVTLDQDSGPLCPLEVHLDDYVNHRLAPHDAAELEAHLPDCPTCSSKERAFEELGDLKAVLLRAVPEPPPGLTLELLQSQDASLLSGDPGTLEDPVRTPAVRPLVACCVVLIVLGLIGLKIVGSRTSKSDPPASHGSSAVFPGSTNTLVSGGDLGTSITLPPVTATTVTVTTTSLPAVTFPTVPSGRKKK